MDPYRIVIADDNSSSREIVKGFIEPLKSFEVVSEASDGDMLIEEVLMQKPEIILVDINMPKMNGVEAVKECKKINSRLVVIFITAYDQYAIEAFNLAATDYIVKPLERKRLFEALDRSKTVLDGRLKEMTPDKHSDSKKLMVQHGSSRYFTPIKDIRFIEKSNRKTIIYTKYEQMETTHTLENLFQQLNDDEFIQSHRSYIINLRHLSKITAKGETFLAYFKDCNYVAYTSKHKINMLENQLNELNKTKEPGI